MLDGGQTYPFWTLASEADWERFREEYITNIQTSILSAPDLEEASSGFPAEIIRAFHESTRTLSPSQFRWLPANIKGMIMEKRRALSLAKLTLAPIHLAMANMWTTNLVKNLKLSEMSVGVTPYITCPQTMVFYENLNATIAIPPIFLYMDVVAWSTPIKFMPTI